MKSPHTSPPKGGARGRPQRSKGGGPSLWLSKERGVWLGVCKVGQPNFPAENASWGHAMVEFLPDRGQVNCHHIQIKLREAYFACVFLVIYVDQQVMKAHPHTSRCGFVKLYRNSTCFVPA